MSMRYATVCILSWLFLPSISAATEAPPLNLPLRFVRDLPVTSIEIAGRRVDVIVDTGGAQTLVLDPDVIAAAGAVPTGGAVTTLDVFGVTREQARFRLPEMALDGRAFKNLDVLAATSDTGAPLPNILGRKLLSQFLVVLDYPARSLRLAAPASRDRDAIGCYGARVPFAQDDATGLVVTMALSDAGRWRLLWDSGAARSQLPVRTAREYHLRTSDEKYASDSLRLGTEDFGPMSFAVTRITLPNRIDGVLGHDFLVNRVVCIDYRRRELAVR